MEVFKRIMDLILRVLAIMALASFIICSVSWFEQRPNRYQIVIRGGDLIRWDTWTGRTYLLFPAKTASGNIEYFTPSKISLKKAFREAGLSDEEIENSIY